MAKEMTIINNHKAKACIIIPNKAATAETFAAKELQYHIQKASQAIIPIYREQNIPPKTQSRIYIGKCNNTLKAGIDISKLQPSEYIIKTFEGNLYLAGKDRERISLGNPWGADWQGTLYAVYDFLENDLGVRWLWPGKLGEVIPQRSNIVIAHLNRKAKPKFISAKLRIPKQPKSLLGWNSKQNKEKFLKDQKLFLLRHRLGAVENMFYGHNYTKYWKHFGKEHPEYFSLLPNGKRQPLRGDKPGRYITLCVSQPTLHKNIISRWEKHRERNPKHIPYRPYVNACENDTPGMCVCDKCRSWDYPSPEFKSSQYWGKGITLDKKNRFSLAEASWGEDSEQNGGYASLSDRYAKFYLTLLAKAKKVDPKAKVVGFAYANYVEAPKSTKLNKDILILFVPPLWFPYTNKLSRTFRKNWNGWSRGGTKLIFRPNLTHAGANLPVFYAKKLADDFSFAAKHGMIATDFDSVLGAWSAQGPTLYTLARIHEHPEWSADKILKEYYSGFGKASNEVKKYFEYWEKYSNSLNSQAVKRAGMEELDKQGRQGGGFKNYVTIAARLFPLKVFKKAHRLIREAKHAAKGDKLAEQRVSFIEKGLIDAELTVKVRLAQNKLKTSPSPKTKKTYLESFKKLKEFRASVENDNVCNFGYMAYREKYGAGWPWKNK
jgi:hypothetical protein